MDNVLKLQHTIDSLFGNGVSKYLPKDLEMTFSRKTGRIKTVMHQDKLTLYLEN